MSAHAATNPAHGPAPADPVSHPLHRTLRRQRGDTRDPAPGQQRNQAAGGAVRRTIDLLRYRYDLERKLRYKTVELIVVEVQWDPAGRSPSAPAPGKPPVMVGVRIRYKEELLRRDAKAAGARWDPESKVWVMTLQVAKRLGLEACVVAVPDEGR